MRALLFLMIALNVLSAPAIIYDESTGRVKQFLEGVNTPEYKGKPGVLLFAVPAKEVIVPACEMKYWKVVGNKVEEMTSDEKATVDAETAAQVALNEEMGKDIDNMDTRTKNAFLVIMDYLRDPSRIGDDEKFKSDVKAKYKAN